MKIALKIIALTSFLLAAFGSNSSTTAYKCLIQLTNYEGEGAYVVVSVLDKEGNYQKTLYVQGDDSEWYRDINEWWKNLYGIKRPDLDGIVGETVAGGQRKMTVLNIPDAMIDSGYSLRFESAVEDQEYYAADVEFALTTENLSGKKDGNGFIRYVRLLKQ